jgi:hypothetical protein
MNCCDANGECRQGRDCPVRKQMTEERMKQVEERYVSWISDEGLGMLILLGSSTAMTAAIVTGVLWLMHR